MTTIARAIPSSGLLTILVVAALAAGVAGGLAGSYLRTPATTTTAAAPQVRDLTIFTTTLPFDDEKVGVPHDVFSVSQIVVNKGDTVRIHLYNTEAEPEDHTFVMDSPYAMRYTLHQGDKADIVFAAGTAGTFAYKCDLHQPTMTGYLTVLG